MIQKKLMTIVAVTTMVAMSYTAQAVLVIAPATATWFNSAGGTSVQVDYQVDLIGGLYYYNYQLRPTVSSGPIHGFEVDVDTILYQVVLSAPTIPDILVATPITTPLGFGSINPGISVNWAFPTISVGGETVVVAFSSPFGPGLGDGSAIDGHGGPWSSTYPGGTMVPVPVPEPATMIAGALLLLPFGASTLRILRKNRTV